MSGSRPDTNKIIQIVRSARPADLEYLSVNQVEKDSVKKASKLVEVYVKKDDWHIFMIRK